MDKSFMNLEVLFGNFLLWDYCSSFMEILSIMRALGSGAEYMVLSGHGDDHVSKIAGY